MDPPFARYEVVGFKKKNGDLGTALPNSLACSLEVEILEKIKNSHKPSGKILTRSCGQWQQFCDRY
jgi:hypothetical protein